MSEETVANPVAARLAMLVSAAMSPAAVVLAGIVGALAPGAAAAQIDAAEQARRVRADVETAAERRRVATLALDARAKGKLDTQAVIVRYEDVTRLDSGLHWDWVELGRLYIEAGRLEQAKQDAQQAAQTATSDLDRSVALDALGTVLVAQGEGSGITSQHVVAAMEDMQARGVLQPADLRFLEDARHHAETSPAR